MKKYLPLLPYGIIVVLIVISVFALREYFAKEATPQAFAKALDIRNAPPATYTDKTGKHHAQKQVVEVTKNIGDEIYRKEIDSLTAALDIKEKQVQGLLLAATKTEGTVPLTIVKDSCNYSFSYADKWLIADGKVGDSSYLHYQITDSLVFVPFWKRKWLLGRKTNYIDAYSLNPNVHVTGLDGARFSIKQPGRFGIGPYVGLGWTGTNWAPSVGLSLHYSLVRF